jgi:transcriptional regulator with XRE-family HTH domain
MASLRSIRETAGMSQAKMAEALGIDRTSYVRIESGQRRLLASELAVIRRVLELSPGEALDLAEAQPEPTPEAA